MRMISPIDSNVVFCSVSGFDPTMRAGRQLTGLLESIDIESTLDVVLKFHPRIREGVWKFYLGHGIVGGKLTSGEAEGNMASQLALRILRGEKASDIPLEKSPIRFIAIGFRLLNQRRFA